MGWGGGGAESGKGEGVGGKNTGLVIKFLRIYPFMYSTLYIHLFCLVCHNPGHTPHFLVAPPNF